MASQGSTMFTIGTLLRHAEDAGSPVRVLVGNTWLEGCVVGQDGLGVVLDNGDGQQALARLDAIDAVMFSRASIDGDAPAEQAYAGGRRMREPIEAGPVGG